MTDTKQDAKVSPSSDAPKAEPHTEKGTLKMMVALTGLLGVMWGYLLFGATAFMLLEGRAERTTPEPTTALVRALDELEKRYINKDPLSANTTLFRSEAESIIRRYTLIVAKAVRAGWKLDHTAKEEWSYEASLFFAASLVTSVGYGNIVPVTSPGRLFTILYSSVGIPLALVCITMMGTIMARGFKALALFLFEDIVTDEGMAYIPLKVSSGVMFSYLFAGAILFRAVGPGWSFLEAFYFCFITLSTIGLGDFVFGEEGSSRDSSFVVSVFYLMLGLSLLSMCFDLMQEQASYKLYCFISWIVTKLKKIKFFYFL